MRNNHLTKLALTALFAALCYVAFTFLKIPLPTPSGTTALHIGNAFCVLCALLLGGVYGGLAGSLGMTVADLVNPAYVTSAPKTFILKLCIGLITGLVAHRVARLSEEHDRKYLLKWTILSSVAGLGFNVVADPLVGYFYKKYLLGVPQEMASVLAKWSSAGTFINAVVSVVVVTVVYMALRPALQKSGLYALIAPEKKEAE